jgi:hypothetical protein
MNDVIILGNFPEFAQIPVPWEDPIPHSPHDGNFSSLAANEVSSVFGESRRNTSMLSAILDHDGQDDCVKPCRLNREVKALQGSSFLLQ